MGFEPTRAEHNGLAVHRLNHSATSSYLPLLTRYMVHGNAFKNEIQQILYNSLIMESRLSVVV